ncbi:MAG TPA: AMP-binding protein [Candidatus Methylomirabilis sp.]|nr:AMP-binding protein [Candidatus Methylomirabilis sp.]
MLHQGDGRVEQRVLEIVGGLVRELGGPPARGAIELDQALDRDLGVGSLERVELLLRIEKDLGVRLSDRVMEEASTPRDLAAAVVTAEPERPAEPPAVHRAPFAPGQAAPVSAGTLLEVLDWHVTAHPERVHVLLAGEPEHPITYGALWQRALRMAAGLREAGVAAGERVALMLRTEPAFFDAFIGTLLAGAVPVPIYPPLRRDRIEEYAERQVRILDSAQACALITFPEAAPVAQVLRSRVRSLRHVDIAAAVGHGSRAVAPPRLGGEDPALIQYTSGSTGHPKGVLLSHANLLANIRAIGAAIAIQPDDVAVSWLPLYHDMGLIGSWLGALYFGIPIAILSPQAFLARPARWLRAIHDHGGTISAAPNFAFDLCVARITDDEIRGLDLTGWRLALNGSEAVSIDTIQRFTRRFAAHGFRAESLCPVYGLAEASVALAMSPPGRPPRIDTIARGPFQDRGEAVAVPPGDSPVLRLVSCGFTLPGHELRIADDADRPLADRREGRILFRGPSVTSGYFRDAAATRAALRDGWMDSGDLGYRADGEIFVTGRRKDLIKKAGRNLYPQELEEIVGAIPGIRKGCVAAFGVPDQAIGTERLVVVAESREPDPSARRRLQTATMDRVVAALGVPPDVVVIAEPRSVLKTSSGKIRRSATRDAYLSGALGRWPSTRAQWLRLLARDRGARARRAAERAKDLLFALYLAGILVPALPALWLALATTRSRRAADRVVKLWCRVVLRLAGCAVRIEGLPHLESGAPAILAANHASYLDVVVLLAALPSGIRFVAKRELLRMPFVSTAIARSGHLTVERGHMSRSVADAAHVTAALREGNSVLVFPEGTFAGPPGILPFRLGAFKSAVETGRPVVPIAIRGTRDILPAGRWLPRPGPATVAIGRPLLPDGSDWPAMVRLRDRARADIARRVNEPCVERPSAAIAS